MVITNLVAVYSNLRAPEIVGMFFVEEGKTLEYSLTIESDCLSERSTRKNSRSPGIKLFRAGSTSVWMSRAAPELDTFEALAMPLFAQLYNFAHWLTQDREEAEDLVQETYAKALKGFSSFQSGTNFRAWMYRILRNTFLTSRTGLRLAATVVSGARGRGWSRVGCGARNTGDHSYQPRQLTSRAKRDC